MLLLQARETVMAQFRPILNAHGVTEQQWRVLRALWQSEAGEPLEPCQLSDACQIVGPSLAGVLRRMEETGWVQRSKMASDQRRVRVSLTPRSRRLVANIAPLIEARYEAMEALVGAGLIDQAYATLDRLLASLGATSTGADVQGSVTRRGPRVRGVTPYG
jgi:homoprotocatechuate degradation regulator HpaR